ncbi:MAG: hypothetical protein QM785_10570 [Pyrinomonadaceae bacterium]
MKIFFGSTLLIASLAVGAHAQAGTTVKQTVPDKTTASTDPADIAKTTLAVHGGDKLKKMNTLLLKGAADLTFNGQAVPGAFSTAISGEKYYFEITTAIQSLKQSYDGVQTSSSLPGFSLPPVTSLGFPLLRKVGDKGYVVTALPDAAKKKKGFRITTPEGFYTDFFVNEKTGQLKSYESKWMDEQNRAITTSVEIDEFQTVDGIVVPKKYAQRFDLGPITAYANFNAKTVTINSTIEDSAFAIGK